MVLAARSIAVLLIEPKDQISFSEDLAFSMDAAHNGRRLSPCGSLDAANYCMTCRSVSKSTGLVRL